MALMASFPSAHPIMFTKRPPKTTTISRFKHANYVRRIISPGVDPTFDFHPPMSRTCGSFCSVKEDCLLVPFGTKRSGHPDEEHGALEAVLKLYSAIKQRNLRELSNVIGDECRCVCNFVPNLNLFIGKKQVTELFAYIMRYMGQNVEFIVQPTLHNGMTVSVKWSLVWDKTLMPLGKGVSFYVCHTYQGKVVIKNMEMIMEPLLHTEPLRLKMMGLVMPMLENIGSHGMINGNGKKIKWLMFIMLTSVALLLLSKLFLSLSLISRPN